MSDEQEKDLGAQSATAVESAEPIASHVAIARHTEDKIVRLTRQDDYEKRWIVVGKQGAIDFHCSLPDIEVSRKYGRTGGVEYHYRAPADYMREDYGCTHDHCWVLGGKCWHDGTSMWASSHWIPGLEAMGEEWVWRELESTYRNHEWPAIAKAEGR